MVANGEVQTNEDCLQTLLAHSSNFDQTDLNGNTALVCGISTRNEFVLEVFQKKRLVLPQDEVHSFLSIAMANDDVGLLRTVRKFMKDINVVDHYGNTPLHLAIREGKEEMIQLLLGWGADMNKSNANGESALNWAANRGLLENLLV
ncbi:hypothetical protein KSS87_001283 [Heliosperma pusillum]|nr:hypothetical protein KSS87_001283 [Heliosperma pusillum]